LYVFPFVFWLIKGNCKEKVTCTYRKIVPFLDLPFFGQSVNSWKLNRAAVGALLFFLNREVHNCCALFAFAGWGWNMLTIKALSAV
ncbi:hypothetical protein D917_05672, partial [Trichinella nativa]